MTRQIVAFAALALGVVLVLPDSSLARPSFRPAFTGGPFRIVVPQGRPHFGGPRIGRPGMTAPHARPTAQPQPPALAPAPAPAIRSASRGPAMFRIHRHVRGSAYPVTVYPYGAYYGAPYDPSDIPVYGPSVVADDSPPPVVAMPLNAPTPQPRGCRADQVAVPNASGAGESRITIVRC